MLVEVSIWEENSGYRLLTRHLEWRKERTSQYISIVSERIFIMIYSQPTANCVCLVCQRDLSVSSTEKPLTMSSLHSVVPINTKWVGVLTIMVPMLQEHHTISRSFWVPES